MSIARNDILFALSIVSSLEVAVMMWDEPDVKDVNKNSLESFSNSEMSMADMAACGQRPMKAVARALEGRLLREALSLVFGCLDLCRRM